MVGCWEVDAIDIKIEEGKGGGGKVGSGQREIPFRSRMREFPFGWQNRRWVCCEVTRRGAGVAPARRTAAATGWWAPASVWWCCSASPPVSRLSVDEFNLLITSHDVHSALDLFSFPRNGDDGEEDLDGPIQNYRLNPMTRVFLPHFFIFISCGGRSLSYRIFSSVAFT